MKTIPVSAFSLAQRFVGVKEISGQASNPIVLGMLRLDTGWPEDDAVPWCSAFVNYVAWLLRLPRSKSLRARSWLMVGAGVADLRDAEASFDVVILKRGRGEQPGPEVIEASGHVGFFAGIEGDRILVLGGNQGDAVSVASFPRQDLLGVRRLA